MICPKCSLGISIELDETTAHQDPDFASTSGGHDLAYGHCPECKHIIVTYRQGTYAESDGFGILWPVESSEIIFPRPQPRRVDELVPDPYRSDFGEAATVISVSAKASAAISRRILQHVLREVFAIKKKDLAQEIDEFVARPDIPSYLSDAVDAVRNVGNFAAHPVKSTSTGEIADVEPGEAEWLLDTLESLFDFAFVQPNRLAAKRAQLNGKLANFGKPPLKGGKP